MGWGVVEDSKLSSDLMGFLVSSRFRVDCWIQVRVLLDWPDGITIRFDVL